MLQLTFRRTFQSRFFSSQSNNKPFRILGLQQIAIGTLDPTALSYLWKDILSIPKISSYTSESENVSEDILSLGKSTPTSVPIEIDLMTPLDPDSSPKVHIPPLNHIGLWVDDLPNAVKWMEENGVRFAPGGIRKGASGFDVTFIHPKGNQDKPIGGCGVLIELVQAPSDVVEKLS